MSPDVKEINRSLQLLFRPGETIELRCLGDKIINGYFRDPAKLAQEAQRANQFQPPINCYVVLNPISPLLYGKRAEQIGIAKKGGGTKDSDIVCRRWLLIDVDPIRPADVSATDQQKQTAQAKAEQVYRYLIEQLRLAKPVVADSGNGTHLLLRLDDLTNDQQSAWACEQLLKHLAERFTDQAVKVDLTTSNAARISCLYGSVKAKGSHTAEQPHRCSRLLSVPDPIERVALQQLLAIVGQPPARQPQQPAEQNGQGSGWNIQQLLDQRGIEYERDDNYQSASGEQATMFILPVCPWNEAHDNRAAFVIQWRSGAIAAGCHHDGCKGKGWPQLKELWGLPAAAGISAADIILPQQPAPQLIQPQAELLIVRSLDVQLEAIDWLWQDRFVVGGINLCAGRGGIGKTYFLCDLVARITNDQLTAPNGQPLRHGRVLYSTGEDHIAKVIEPRMRQHTVNRDRLEYIKGLPAGPYIQLLDVIQHVDLLRDAIRKRPDTIALVLDPISSFQGMTDSNKVSQVRRFTAVLTQLAEEYGIAVLGIHHFNKGKRDVAGDAISGSHAYRDAARSIWLFGLDSSDPTRRLMVCDKHNWAAERPSGLAYRITGGLILYEPAPLEMTADELMTQGVQQSLDIACSWLLAQLSSGPRPAIDIQIAATAEGLKDRTVRRAKERLGVQAYKQADRWYWSLQANQDGQTPTV